MPLTPEQAKAAAERDRRRQAKARQRALAVVILTIVVGIALVAVTLLTGSDDEPAPKSSPTTTPTAGGPTPANLTDGGIVIGEADAPVTVTIYEDLLCPFCKQAHDTNKDQYAAWVAEGKVKLDYRPISFLDRASSDQYSTRALNAIAAVVNSAPEAFPKYHDALLAEQPAEGGEGLSDGKLIELAVAAGAPEAEIREAVENRTFFGWTVATTQQANQAGVNGTPTIFVNKQQVPNPTDPQQVKDQVESAAKG